MREAMSAFLDRGWEAELIVCDNNSTDATAAIAESAGARVVFEPVNQIGRARNSGAAAATGDWLVFVDADSRPSKALFEDVADAIGSESCLAGGSVVRMEGGPWWTSLATGFWNSISRLNRWMAGSFIFCEAAAFREMGGFNEELFASEEIDLSMRLKRLARRRQRRIVILHRHPLLTSSRKMQLYSKKEMLAFLWRYVKRPLHTVRTREYCGHWYDGRR
jgi:glycosyltransferase involved in cell wall biosynthesis